MTQITTIDTCYGPIAQTVMEKAAKIRLLICDVDGVMSDGLIYQGNSGEELKAFNVRDGYGIRCLLTSGVEVAIITGRKAKLLEDRGLVKMKWIICQSLCFGNYTFSTPT